MTREVIYFDSRDYLEGLLGMNDDEIWEAGINLDDWDYGLVLKGHVKTMSRALTEDSSHLNRLLTGCCDNEWYEVTSKTGEKYTIGMAYHA